MEIIEKISGKAGLEARIYQDNDPECPREWDNLGRIVTVHLSRHSVADKGEKPLPEDLGSWDQVEAYLKRERGAVVILPVFLYDHSVQSVSTKSFVGRAQHANWDSGQVGFIYATRVAVLANWDVKSISPIIRDRVVRVLEGEIETLDQYMRGEVYGYAVGRVVGLAGKFEELNSCWGHYGMEDVESAARGSLAWYGQHDKEA
jgi:hypothetical protein